MNEEAIIYATAYAAILSATHNGTSIFKVDPDGTRERAAREASRAVDAWRSHLSADASARGF